ncbi:MAG: SDR family oxidoreductase [Microbacteriaceae bacterium]|nr:SDR family oxidoreductase [Microbacteriaceae bacterium]
MSRVIAVTGGSSGIGAKIVEQFTNQGATVVILDRNQPSGSQDFVQCDLSDFAAIDSAVGALPAQLDVFVNAAGISGLAPIPKVMKVNFYGLRHLTEAVAGRIASGGSVINIASTSSWYWRDHLTEIATIMAARDDAEIEAICAKLITDGYTAYARSKEAVLVWSAVAAQEYLGRFRINSVSPGPIETPLLADFYEAMGHEELDPLTKRAGGRNGRPDEIASVVTFLASNESNWINGTDIPVDNSAEISEFLAANNVIPPLEK